MAKASANSKAKHKILYEHFKALKICVSCRDKPATNGVRCKNCAYRKYQSAIRSKNRKRRAEAENKALAARLKAAEEESKRH